MWNLARRLVFFFLVACVAPASARSLESEVQRLAGPAGVVYVADEKDTKLLGIRADRSFVPASTIKIFTCLLAIEHLGLDHRFSTELFLDDGLLVVRGSGDPFLVSEEVEHIAAELRRRLPSMRLDGVAIDDSFFAAGIVVPGVSGSEQPYDALNSATAVNFNTIHVQRVGDRIVSAEEQTPLTPTAERVARRHGVRGKVRINLGKRPDDVRRYAAELIALKLRAAGIHVDTRIEERAAPAGAAVYVHENRKTLADVCEQMLYYSNNYVANQTFLHTGAAVYGAPATLDKSRRAAQRYVERHPELAGLSVWEGSGISYENRVTATALAAVLERFAPYKHLLRRKYGTPNKTGTLKKTKSVAGYLETGRHGDVRFVISLDGDGSERRWQILDLLRRGL